jgi:hypothetical protein
VWFLDIGMASNQFYPSEAFRLVALREITSFEMRRFAGE